MKLTMLDIREGVVLNLNRRKYRVVGLNGQPGKVFLDLVLIRRRK